jgi:hypothetical protein
MSPARWRRAKQRVETMIGCSAILRSKRPVRQRLDYEAADRFLIKARPEVAAQ